MKGNLRFKYSLVAHEQDNGETTYGIHELYFEANGRFRGYTVEPLFGYFSSREELISFLYDCLKEGKVPPSVPGNLYDVSKWSETAWGTVKKYGEFPPGEVIISSPTPDPNDPWAMEVVIVKYEH